MAFVIQYKLTDEDSRLDIQDVEVDTLPEAELVAVSHCAEAYDVDELQIIHIDSLVYHVIINDRPVGCFGIRSV